MKGSVGSEQRVPRRKGGGCWEGEAKDSGGREQEILRTGVPNRHSSLGTVKQGTHSQECLTTNPQHGCVQVKGTSTQGGSTPQPPFHLAPVLRYRPEPSPGRVLGQNEGFPVVASGGHSSQPLPTRGSEKNPTPQ